MGDAVTRRLSWLSPGALRWASVLTFVLLAIGAGAQYGLGVAILVLACGALLASILIFWWSLQGLAGETPLTLDEALSLAAPSAEEEQKQAVLRALKDLDYERSVGKITEEDYQELSQRYRAEAKALLLLVDRDLSPALKKAEALIAERLGKPHSSAAPEAEPVEPSSTPCPQCGTQNDADARFCKSCAAALVQNSEPTP